jgi:murein DD-endopeptidase MepM/ murein hydrolase activator NlpD
MFRWPLTTTGINSLYGERIDPIDGKRRFHAGIDIAASYGALVSAAAPGVVQHADWTHGHGRQVVIEHNGGFRTIYSHLAQVLVLPGSVVQAGTVIGQVGNSGRSTGAHLHFAVTHWNNPIDPLEVLAEP